jgi:hypothetical protein
MRRRVLSKWLPILLVCTLAAVCLSWNDQETDAVVAANAASAKADATRAKLEERSTKIVGAKKTAEIRVALDRDSIKTEFEEIQPVFNALTAARNNLTGTTDITKEPSKQVLERMRVAERKLNEAIGPEKGIKGALKNAPAIYVQWAEVEVKDLVGKIDVAVRELKSFSIASNPTAAASALTAAQSAQKALIGQKQILKNDKKLIEDALTLYKLEPTLAGSLDNVSDGSAESLKFKDELQPLVEGAFSSLHRILSDRAAKLERQFVDVTEKPWSRAKGVVERQKAESDYLEGAQKLIDALVTTAGWDVSKGEHGEVPLKVQGVALDARQARELLQLVVKTLPDAAGGSQENFVGKLIPLYYFRDVTRLVEILQPNAMGKDFAGDLATKRRTSLEKLGDVEKAALAVAGLKDQLSKLQRDEENAKNALASAERLVQSLENRLDRAKSRQSQLARDIEKTNERIVEKPDDKRLKDQLERQEDLKARIDEDVAKQTIESTEATTKRTEARDAYDKAGETGKGLKQQVADAEASLVSKAVETEEARRTLRLAEFDEDQSLKSLRLSNPIVFAPANLASLDPVQRVYVMAFKNASTLFLRGRAEDVAKVEAIVAEYDRPAPQARLAIWEMQVNVTQDDQGLRAFRDSNWEVQQRLLTLRQVLTGSTGAFVGAVNKVANAALSGGLPFLRNPYNRTPYGGNPPDESDSGGTGRDGGEEAHKRGPWVPEPAFGRTPPTQRWDQPPYREFYSGYVVESLTPPNPSDFPILRDPRSASTLGEAMLTFVLARPKVQQLIWQEFLSRLSQEKIEGFLRDKEDAAWLERLKDIFRQRSKVSPVEPFQALRRQLMVARPSQAGKASDANPTVVSQTTTTVQTRTPKSASVITTKKTEFDAATSAQDWVGIPRSESEVTPLQTEIVTAIASRHLTLFQKTYNTLQRDYQAELRERIKMADPQKIASQDDLRSYVALASEAERDTLEQNIVQAEKTLQGNKASATKRFIDFRTFFVSFTKLAGINAGYSVQMSDLGQLSATSRALAPDLAIGMLAQHANARSAAADAMLKELMKALEDDLDQLVVTPGLRWVQQAIQGRGVQFGKMQKSSLLVTNRFVAGMSARAEAEVSPVKQTDILSDALALLQVATAVPGSNPTGLLGLLSKSDTNKTPPPNQIYGITSSGSFQITPVFEPTGQSLRFGFDYSIDNRIREPNNTVDPRRPVVERHSISNEMQVGNLEIREISSFETNAKLGTADKKWGGIPILNDLYPLSEVPIIGWFHYRRGRAAVAQQSIILAQASLYPTIGDILNLMGGN